MSPGPVKAIIVGHSFVKRLADFCSDRRNFANLRLETNLFHVEFKGVSGAKVSHSNSAKSLGSMARTVSDMCPDIVYIDIGSNDLCSRNVQPTELALRIFDISTELSKSCKCVVIGQILPRLCESSTYNERVRSLNEKLKHLASEANGNVIFWKMEKVWRVNGIYHRDGVHLSNPLGMDRYARNVRGAVLFASRRFY